jgi:hypothetical protein
MKAMVMAAGVAALALQLAALPAVAQTAGIPYEQVKRKYRKMSPVFIEKCDKNGDRLFTNVEMQCVAGIYQAMYIEK